MQSQNEIRNKIKLLDVRWVRMVGKTPRTVQDVMNRDSAVGIATRYGLDGPGIESRWRVRFSAPVQTGPVAHPASCRMGIESFPGVKRPGMALTTHPHPAPKLKKE